MQDHLVRAIAPGIRAFAVVTTNLVEEARRRHDCYPVATAALGRTMTAAMLMGANLKNQESITIRIAGDGPLGEIIADGSSDGTVRGYVHNPHVDLPLRNGKLDVGKGVGSGQIYVTRFLGLKQPFTGSSPLKSGEIAEDITNYMYVSEQTPSSVALGVLVDPSLAVLAAGGFMIQAMPGADETILKRLEVNLAGLSPITTLLTNGIDPSGILKQVFAGLELKFTDRMDVAFACRCSRDRVESMLVSLGAEEVKEMIKDGHAEVRCHFCNEKYQFECQELQSVLAKIENPV
jgi:molecular chaperone Hsp33